MREMMRLSTLIEQFEAPLLAQYADQLLPEHRQALLAMKPCRNALSPRSQAQCLPREEQMFVPIPAAAPLSGLPTSP